MSEVRVLGGVRSITPDRKKDEMKVLPGIAIVILFALPAVLMYVLTH